jgi:hypothetical protein
VAAGLRNHFDLENVSVIQNRPFTGGLLRFGGRQGNRQHGCRLANKSYGWRLIGSVMDQDFVDQPADDLKCLVGCFFCMAGRMKVADFFAIDISRRRSVQPFAFKPSK